MSKPANEQLTRERQRHRDTARQRGGECVWRRGGEGTRRQGAGRFAHLLICSFAHLLICSLVWGQSQSPAKGRWMSFPGQPESFLEAEDHPSLNLRSQITIEAWVFARQLPKALQSRWQLVHKGTAYNLALLRTAIPGQVLIEVNRVPFIIQNEFRIGEWNHVGGAYDANKGQAWFYLNGKVHHVEDGEQRELESESPLQVGQDFDGGIDALRISKTVRYRGEYEPPMNHFDADLHTVLLWHFEDEEDSSKNENDFVPQGEGLRFVGTPYRDVKSIGKLAMIWGRLKK